jgi:class 3 adenylate cyclase
MSTPIKRKLAAILAADAVGYSRAMAADEEGTMKILAAHRAVIDGIIQFHEGRIVNTAGDSVIAEFASPTQAVRCAVEIQDALKTRNDSLPEDRRMEFRIGVNLGDVMVRARTCSATASTSPRGSRASPSPAASMSRRASTTRSRESSISASATSASSR